MIDLRREGCLLVFGAFLFIPSAIACDGSTYAVQQWHGMPSASHVLQSVLCSISLSCSPHRRVRSAMAPPIGTDPRCALPSQIDRAST